LPRSLGPDPSTGEEIVVHLGRYGAYLERGERRSPLDAHEQVLSITLEDAVAHLAIPDSTTEVVVDLGRDPGTDRVVVVERITYRSGESHDVLTDGVTRVSSFRNGRLRRQLADLTASDAYRLLAEQRERDENSSPRRHRP
jgi:DNA topoisomerase-1